MSTKKTYHFRDFVNHSISFDIKHNNNNNNNNNNNDNDDATWRRVQLIKFYSQFNQYFNATSAPPVYKIK